MKRWHKAVIVGAVAATTLATVAFRPPGHIGPAYLYPDTNLTPGLVATQSLGDLTQTTTCGTYSECHRNTTAAQKSAVEREYPQCPPQHEIDHLVPLALGGADNVKNLWCQPAHSYWDHAVVGLYPTLVVYGLLFFWVWQKCASY